MWRRLLLILPNYWVRMDKADLAILFIILFLLIFLFVYARSKLMRAYFKSINDEIYHQIKFFNFYFFSIQKDPSASIFWISRKEPESPFARRYRILTNVSALIIWLLILCLIAIGMLIKWSGNRKLRISCTYGAEKELILFSTNIKLLRSFRFLSKCKWNLYPLLLKTTKGNYTKPTHSFAV